jgi:hypothetical protein
MEEKKNFKDFSKKNNNENKGDQEDRFYAKEVEKRVDFHVMPDKFRKNKKEMDKTKKTGILIIVFGMFFLAAISVLLYIVLFGGNEEKEVKIGKEVEYGDVPEISEKEAEEEDRKTDDLISEEENMEEEETETETETATSSPETETETATSSPETETETETETATSSPETETESESNGLIVDLDEDGLSDKEEILFGTSDDNLDSDGDGYDDFVELENLYDPDGTGLLKDNPNIESYSNNSYGYKILYPVMWERSDLGGDDITMFSSKENHFIQIIAQENLNSLSIRDWLSEQLGENTPILDREISKKGWEGVFNEAGNIIYAFDEDKKNIFIISYSFNQGEEPIYNNIFNMIINSFEIIDGDTEI